MAVDPIYSKISKQLQLSIKQIATVSALLDEGATIPFLARYRKEVTEGLDEEQLRDIRDQLELQRALEARKQTVLTSIEEQGKLTNELKTSILACDDLVLLEDLYLPYKQKRKTRGDKAKEKGLEPLAELIWKQEVTQGNPVDFAKNYITQEKEVHTIEEAWAGAIDIVAEWINESIAVREELRNIFFNHATISTKKTSKVKERTNFEDYYDASFKATWLKPHQILAINRGEREKILSVKTEVWEERTLETIDDIVITNEDSIFTGELQDSVEEAYKRLLFPSIERELRNNLTEKADQHAIETFATNLSNLLMQPPIQNKVIMGIDPAYRTGCKVAVVDETGKYFEGTTIYPTPPQKKVAEAEAVLDALISKYKVNLIAIGNGTASRETEQFVANYIQQSSKANTQELSYLIVNEAGASVYSASKIAREEFPELDAAQRGNISIARRVLDPLAELVKIDPKSIGVGLYQHDINQTQLSSKLDDVVESCVNEVGVNLNTASAPLLSHISGLSKKVADNIVAHREKEGIFSHRDEIKDVAGVGDFRFQQAAGFLRIPEAKNPLDNTGIHPESYAATEQLCNVYGINLETLSQERDVVESKLTNIPIPETAQQLGIGEPTLALIIEHLLKPGRDPREDMPKPLLRTDVMDMNDLKEGQKLEGTVRNVVDFGAFVDVGVKQDGLLHISNMSLTGRRIEDPHDVVGVGDIISVEVITLDLERGRIGLKLV